MAKRLTKEAKELASNPLDFGFAEPVGDDLFSWTATVIGPEASPYENGVFQVEIKVPSEYPFKAPKVRFVTRVYHPNVKSSTGEICSDLLKEQWKPTLNIRWVLGILKSLFDSVESDSPLEPEIAKQVAEDREGFNAVAREWTVKYAS